MFSYLFLRTLATVVCFLIPNEKGVRKLSDQNLRYAGAQIDAKSVQMITDLFASSHRRAPQGVRLGATQSPALTGRHSTRSAIPGPALV